MNSREDWQALQARIAAARLALGEGDPARALQEVESALAIDPQFLAAQALRDRILSLPAEPAPAPQAADRPAGQPSGPPTGGIVSAEGYARFEERARRRRVDRRLDAARNALADRRLREASAALEEVAELDPNVPELAALSRQLDEMREATGRPHHGPWLAAAAVFGGIMLGASYLQESGILQSRPVSSMAPLVATPMPQPVVPEPSSDAATPPDVAVPVEVAGSSGSLDAAPPPDKRLTDSPAPDSSVVPALRETRAEAGASTTARAPEARTADVAPAAAPPPAAPLMPPAEDPSAILPQAAVPPPSVSRPAPIARAAPESEAAPPAAVPTRSSTPPSVAVDEEALVKQALQRYRTAYEGLDAHSAQAVWPAVNEAALARAFDSLQSQHLTFDVCTVQLGGNNRAAATCRGSARYVPKVGSREPRIEPRVWTFALTKAGAEWRIDAARAER